MRQKALVFPQTALRPSVLAGLAPLFRPVMVLAPPSLAPEARPKAADLGLIGIISPADGQGLDHGGPQAGRVAKLLRDWEQWVRDNQGTGKVESVKAGVAPPAPPETHRSLMQEIRNFGQIKEDRPPVADADLFLHLAHVQDTEAADLERILGSFEEGREKLNRSMGMEEEDHQTVDYENYRLEELPPLDYTLPAEKHLDRRLSAWATLAGTVALEGAWPAAANLPAARALIERASGRLSPPDPDLHSPAGVTAPFHLPKPEPELDSPLPRELVRLAWPDLSDLTEDGLGALNAKLEETGALDSLSEGWASLGKMLAEERWSGSLAANAATQAAELAQGYKNALTAAGAELGETDRRLSLVVLPGLTWADALALMKGDESVLGDPAAWPGDWPVGTLAVLTVW